MSLDDITALVQSMSIQPTNPPSRNSTSDKPKSYHAVPPPAAIQPQPRKQRYTPRLKPKSAENPSPQNLPSNRPRPPPQTFKSDSTTAPPASQPAPTPQPRRRKPRTHPLRQHQSFVPESPDIAPPAESPERVYTVMFEPYGIIVGVFRSITTATSAVKALGAGQGSKAGLDGLQVFWMRGGRLEIVPVRLQGVRAEGEGTEGQAAKQTSRQGARDDIVYLAVDGSLIIGVFKGKAEAWDACLEHREQLSWCATAPLKEGSEWVDTRGLPRARGRIEGGGWHEWGVEVYELDEILGLREKEKEKKEKERSEGDLERRLRDVETRLMGIGIRDTADILKSLAG